MDTSRLHGIPALPAWVRIARGVALAAIALAFGGPVPAQIQIPGLASSSAKDAKEPAKAPEVETPAQGLARARRQLEETRAAMARNESAPPGVSEAEAGALQDVLLETRSSYEAQIRQYEALSRASALRQEAERRVGTTTLTTPPPYSILVGDELRASIAAQRARIDTLRSAEMRLKREAERYFAQSQRANEALRRASEAAETAGGADAAAAAWRRKGAEAGVRLAAARTTLAQLVGKSIDEEVAARTAELAVIEADLATVVGHVRFTREDLDATQTRVRESSARHRKEQERFGALAVDYLKQRDAAARELERLRANGGASTDDVALAEARVALAEARLRGNEAELDAARGAARLTDATAQAWADRFAVLSGSNPVERAAAIERLRALSTTLANWAGYARNVVAEARLELREADVRRQAATVPGTASLLQDAADARRRGVAALEGVEDEIDRATQSVDAWIAEFDHTQGERTAGQRMTDGWSAFKSAVTSVWNFELFSVEDSVVVDGQHVTVARGVTVGKSIGALLIFLGGLWAVGSLLRVLERRLVARGFNPPWVRTFKRWVMVLAALVLLLLTLNAARIPLTVFAFLGGALAIGVGFGTQTIIRNFISGMIVLAERRVRIGDTIEVDGITGTVASVDFRSTTVRGFDGVETIVPNSVLLENKVTNWTFTDQKVRRAVRIGVAYGSDLRIVSDLLEETVKRHGNVLGDPAPQVYLDDFGDNAVMFLVHFWVDLAQVANSVRVISDLRFMIGKRLDEAGIVIAFPQRDVHLDAPRPLKVEIVRDAGAPGAVPG
jgi:small-conductance mechanosensitive channel